MSGTAESHHPLDRCPVCGSKIDTEALYAPASAAKKMTKNGKGYSAGFIRRLRVLQILAGLVCYAIGLSNAGPSDAGLPELLFASAMLLLLAYGFVVEARASGRN